VGGTDCRKMHGDPTLQQEPGTGSAEIATSSQLDSSTLPSNESPLGIRFQGRMQGVSPVRPSGKVSLCSNQWWGTHTFALGAGMDGQSSSHQQAQGINSFSDPIPLSRPR
jgi:hypothetical protein